MIETIGLLLGGILPLFRARRTLLLENLALRQQLAAVPRHNFIRAKIGRVLSPMDGIEMTIRPVIRQNSACLPNQQDTGLPSTGKVR